MAALLALASALCWGSADYLGGVQSRRVSAITIALWSQLAGGLALLVVVILAGRESTPESLAWGAAAGLFTGSALMLFYRGLSTGAMAIVAPISACGAAVPVIADVARGEVPNALQLAGIALCLAGAIAISVPATPESGAPTSPRLAVALGAAAALGFGFFYLLVDKGNDAGGSALWVIVGARAGSLAAILSVVSASRTLPRLPRQLGLPVVVTGVLDTSANVLFAVAATRGELGVVSVLGSLYPVTTVVLAVTIGGERATVLRLAAGAVALAGVAILSAA